MATVTSEPQEGVYVPGYGYIPTYHEVQQFYKELEALATEIGVAAETIHQEARQVIERYNSAPPVPTSRQKTSTQRNHRHTHHQFSRAAHGQLGPTA